MNTINETDPKTLEPRNKNRFNMRRLRLSLKYRPDILKLILKMRQSIQKKNELLKKLKQQLKCMGDKYGATDTSNDNNCDVKALKEEDNQPDLKEQNESQRNSTTQTDILLIEKKESIDKSTSYESSSKDCSSQTKTHTDGCVNELIIKEENKTNASNETQNSLPKEKTEISFNENLAMEESMIKTETRIEEEITDIKANSDKDKCSTKDSSTQTEDIETYKDKLQDKNEDDKKEDQVLGWTNTENGKENKSIAEQVAEVAQSAMQQSGMVYVESAGMYYDYKTGYYYNSELGLYYHTDTGCYYYYSNEQKTFVFHSYPDRSIETQNEPEKPIRRPKKHKKDEDADASKPKRKKLTKKIKKIKDTDVKEKSESVKEKDNSNNNVEKADVEVKDESNKEDIAKDMEAENKEKVANPEVEDGECSASDAESESSEDEDLSTSTASEDESVAKHHPPCMRVVVRETNLPKLKVGSLFLVTKDGGTIGREGDHHAIVIKDFNVSKNHLGINFDADKRIYTAVDLGSKNGTILNGVRMSDSQEVSKPMEVVHGSTIQLGETKLLCHIHAGTDTCGHCEPGLILEARDKESKVAYTRTCSVQKQHQLELARLKNKYAPKLLEIEETAYNDRAQARRETVGSSHHSEKTQRSDLDTFIPTENKGFKMLEKMGWSKGEGLGKDSQGDIEPIPLVSNEGKSGLGAPAVPSAPPGKLATATLRLAARTKMLQKPAKAFQQPADEDSE